MRPTHQTDRYTLYRGDCLEVLPTLEAGSVDAVITDPPYPYLSGGLKHSVGGVTERVQETVTVGSLWGDDLSGLTHLKRVCKYGAVVFCSWHSIDLVKELCGGEAVGLVTWYKRNSQPSFRNRPHYQCEFAWLIEYKSGLNWKPLKTFYDIAGLPAGCFATERVLDGTGKAAHPTQKPLELIEKFMQICDGVILDPFMGSGTTGAAAMRTGRKFIGVELDAGYYDIAHQRIANAAGDFCPAPKDNERQMALFWSTT